MANKRPAAAKKPAKKRKAKAPRKSREVRAVEAIAAQLGGATLTRQQARDAKWWRDQQAEAAIWDWVASCPKKDYCRLTDRQHKLIDDAARTYGLPIDGPTVDLSVALQALHDLIAANAPRLRGSADRHELEVAKLEEELSRLQIGNDKQRLELSRLRGETIVRKEIEPSLLVVFAALRNRLEPVAKRSPKIRSEINDALDALADEVESGRLDFDSRD